MARQQSALEATFLGLLAMLARDIPDPRPEFKFALPRKWRFDYAWPDALLAVEIEGGLYKGGRHQTLNGFVDDAEKYEAALLQGWSVYRVPGRG